MKTWKGGGGAGIEWVVGVGRGTYALHLIDIIRLENGRYAEHWGMSNPADILKEIQSPAL